LIPFGCSADPECAVSIMSEKHKVHVEFPARILFVGFGSIGQGVLPLVLRHIGIAPERITIVTADDRGREEAAKFGI